MFDTAKAHFRNEDVLSRDLLIHLEFIAMNEWQATKDHGVERDPKGPYINLASDRWAIRLPPRLKVLSIAELGSIKRWSTDCFGKLDGFIKYGSVSLGDLLMIVIFSEWFAKLGYSKL